MGAGDLAGQAELHGPSGAVANADPMARTRVAPAHRMPVHPGFLIAALFLVSLNLRAAMASVPPLLAAIERDTGLSSTGAGLLTALPVVCMGVFAPAAHRLAHTLGREAAVAAALLVLTAGLLLRLAGDALLPLFAGTLLAGVGIAIVGTVLPGILKEFLARRAGAVTGIYLMGMALGAAIASGAAVPMADVLGSWEASLAAWGGLAVVALLAWAPVAWRFNEHEPEEETHPGHLPWRSRTAWFVSGYLALQSFLFYAQLAWIAPSYQAAGWSPADAGLLLSLFMLTQLVAALVVPALSDRADDRRPWFVVVIALSLLGMLALLAWPDVLPWLFVGLLGFGQGGGFALGLVLLVDHARDPAASGRLSAMAFLVGYSVAALGPTTVGLLRDLTGGYGTGWALLILLGAAQLALALEFTPARRVRGV